MSNEVYWRVMRKGDDIVFPCMQDFDEIDYDQSAFLTEKQFDTEEAAQQWAYGEMARVLRLFHVAMRYMGLH